MSRRALLVTTLLVLFAALYGGIEIRNRARTDLGPKYHRTDFTVYQAAARALRSGENPYEAENPRGLRYVYPPFLAILLMPAAPLSAPAAALLFFLVSFAALAGAVRAMARFPFCSPRAAVLALLACVPFLHQSFQRGQVTVLLLAVEVGALVLLVGRRNLAAGLLLGLGGALRITPLIPAAAAGMGALAAWRRRGPGPFLRLSAGVFGGLFLALVVLPVAVLGPSGALRVNRQWLDTARRVYAAAPGELADLKAEYRINEYRFKNQAPRRVIATWTGWISGADFEREKPALSDGSWRAVDTAAFAVAAAAILAVLAAGWRRLRDPDAPGFGAAFAAASLLALLAERYLWPTHLAAAFPALAFTLAPLGGRRLLSRGFVAFVAGTLLFYAGYAEALEPVAAAGPLLLGTVWLSFSLLRSP